MYHCLINDEFIRLMGSVTFGLPPRGLPSLAWYGPGPYRIALTEYAGNRPDLSMDSNDDGWSDGWPGAALDKKPFASPEAITLILLGFGWLVMGRRRPAH